MERLDKLLAATGRWSRKEAKALIKSGRVLVDGQRPNGPEDKVPPEARLTLDGRPLAADRYTYLMLHKPPGVVSSTQDPRDPTVLTLLPPHLQKPASSPWAVWTRTPRVYCCSPTTAPWPTASSRPAVMWTRSIMLRPKGA